MFGLTRRGNRTYVCRQQSDRSNH